MSNFVRCSNGDWVNLDLVAKMVRIGKSGNRVNTYRFLAATGEDLGVSTAEFSPILGSPIVPAHPLEAVFEFYSVSTQHIPSDVGSIVEAETPILGWRCGDVMVSPITYSPDVENGASTFLYRMADGRFKEPSEGAIFENLEKARAFALKDIQSKWPAEPGPTRLM